MKSNTQRAIYEPCNILHSNPCLKAVNYCYRELHVTCGRSSGSVSDKVLNQQLETFSRKGTTSLSFSKSLKELYRSLRYLIQNRYLYEFTHTLAKFLKITRKKKIIFTKKSPHLRVLVWKNMSWDDSIQNSVKHLRRSVLRK